ncbi:hypothetical protein GCM10023347_47660 [Streptomyces chumphonensis]|nr:NUDIX hydrolase [Streptomyces chumphonensis]
MTTMRDASSAGRPFPLSQADYLATLPKATIYACVLLTDGLGRVVQLRSVFRDRSWQLPGGNMDPGEDPLRTAVRETHEETGLRLHGPLPLLLMHYARADSRDAPLAKVGFCFDGGTLTERQIAGIRLDPQEHHRYAVEDWATWERLMPRDAYRRIAAMAEARRTGRTGLLVTEPHLGA